MPLRLLRLAWACALFGVAGLRAAADEPACRADYVVPYAEQCKFAYAELHKNAAPQNLSAAFTTCDRAQHEAVACVKSPVRDTHVVALSALYQSVARQASIAMYAQQYRVAEALLREQLDVLAIVARDAPPGDKAPAEQRKAVEGDLADARAGLCTETALAAAGQQFALGKAHKYRELATLLRRKSNDYRGCAKMPTTAAKKAYVEYLSLVALEESGRATQAAGAKVDADRVYQDCIDGASRSSRYAAPRVKEYLTTVRALCAGRKDGKYRIDQPAPIDSARADAFAPLTLPKT